MHIVVFVKQVPAFDAIEFDAAGRIERESQPAEMNPFCRRAVAQATTLVAEHGGSISFVTMGPPQAADVLKEARVWAGDRGVDARAVLVSDPRLAGLDVVRTASVLAEVVAGLEPFDVLLCGAASVDSGTSLVPALVAAAFDEDVIERVDRLEYENGAWVLRQEDTPTIFRRTADVPVVVSCAERLCDPCKVSAERRSSVGVSGLATLSLDDLANPPNIAPAAMSRVVDFANHTMTRLQLKLTGTAEQQAREALHLLNERTFTELAASAEVADPRIERHTLEPNDTTLAPHEAAALLLEACERTPRQVVTLRNTPWGRATAARFLESRPVAVLTDVTDFWIEDGEVRAQRPTRGGLTDVTIAASTSPVLVLERTQPLDDAEIIIGVGRGIAPSHFPELEALAASLGATLAASRKVTDAGWMPRHLQIGVTGVFVAPQIYIALGTSGRFNHAVGFQASQCVIAMNNDPSAPVFDRADIGMVGDGMELLRAFVNARTRSLSVPSHGDRDPEGHARIPQG